MGCRRARVGWGCAGARGRVQGGVGRVGERGRRVGRGIGVWWRWIGLAVVFVFGECIARGGGVARMWLANRLGFLFVGRTGEELT